MTQLEEFNAILGLPPSRPTDYFFQTPPAWTRGIASDDIVGLVRAAAAEARKNISADELRENRNRLIAQGTVFASEEDIAGI